MLDLDDCGKISQLWRGRHKIRLYGSFHEITGEAGGTEPRNVGGRVVVLQFLNFVWGY